MIKFFRKVRQNLLIEGKTGKYFKYAFGEILLVVIGILIALQINDWNEQQKLRKLEVSYYKNLKIDLVKDSLDYEFKSLNAQQNMTKLTNILNFINNGYDITKTEISDVYWEQVKFQDTMALWLSISQSGFVQFPHIFENTITDLRATGNIKLLTNIELKNELVNYYNRQNLFDDWNQSYLPNRTQIDLAVNHILPLKARTAYNQEDWSSIYDNLNDFSEYGQFIESIKSQKDFKALLVGMYHIQSRIVKQCYQRASNLIEINEAVEKEIKKLSK
jgi:hypothetical protein